MDLKAKNRLHKLLRILLLLFLLSTSGCIFQSSPTRGCPPVPTPIPINRRPPFQGRIGVTLSCGFFGTQEIYIMNADGSGTINLTSHPANDLELSWAPNGQRIAFASDRNGNYDIYVVNTDGTELTRLTDHPEDDRMPEWSPDGQNIMFLSRRDKSSTSDTVGEVYIMASDGTGQQKLFQNASVNDLPVYNSSLSKVLGDWSPDGKHFVTSYQRDIFIFHMNNSPPTNITDHIADDMKPQWSPDGKHVLFLSNRNGGKYDWEIFVFDIETNDTFRLASLTNQRPKWSPDGRMILFTSRATGNNDLYSIKVDGSNLTNLTSHPAHDSRGEWSPDGKYISFFSGRDNNKLYIMNADGSMPFGFLHDILTHEHSWSPKVQD